MRVKGRVFNFQKDKRGNTLSPITLVLPDSVENNSILSLIVDIGINKTKYYHQEYTVLKHLTNKIDSTPILQTLKKSPASLSLDEVIIFRNQLKEKANDACIPKTVVTKMCTLMAGIDTKLSCGRKIKEWPKYKEPTVSTAPRQIGVKNILSEALKGAENAKEGKVMASDAILSTYNNVFDSANKEIDMYLNLLNLTKEWTSESEIKEGDPEYEKIYSRFKRLKSKLGISGQVSGRFNQHTWESRRGTLPPRILLCILIVLKLETPWNSDVWLLLTNDNISLNMASVDIINPLKGKTNKLLDDAKITNRDRTQWKAINLLITHYRISKGIIESNKIQTKRVQLLFDYITDSPLESGTIVKDFQFLTGNCLGYFITQNNLAHFTLDTLRNLTATKKYLVDGATIGELKKMLNHGTQKITEEYINQHILSEFLSHNMLCFMREFENDAVFVSDAADLFHNYVIDIKNESGKYFRLSDGSSCADPYDSPDPHQSKGDLCNGKACNQDCPNKKLILDEKQMVRALITREYYRSNFFYISTNNIEKFTTYDASKVLFNILLCTFIKTQKPKLYASIENKVKQRNNK